MVGEAIKSSNISRSEFFITTKLWCTELLPEKVRPALELSLKKLQVEYVDLYLIHWPVAFKSPQTTPPEVIPVDLSQTWKELEVRIIQSICVDFRPWYLRAKSNPSGFPISASRGWIACSSRLASSLQWIKLSFILTSRSSSWKNTATKTTSFLLPIHPLEGLKNLGSIPMLQYVDSQPACSFVDCALGFEIQENARPGDA